MILEPKCHAEIIVDQPIDIVWNIITDSSKFDALNILGSYTLIDRKHARSGTRFECNTFPKYIIAWKPPIHFSFGNSPSEWDVEWRLSPNGGKTIVQFTRRFGTPFLQWVADRYLGDNRLQTITEKTVASLKDACSRLASGEGDRLSPSSR